MSKSISGYLPLSSWILKNYNLSGDLKPSCFSLHTWIWVVRLLFQLTPRVPEINLLVAIGAWDDKEDTGTFGATCMNSKTNLCAKKYLITAEGPRAVE